MNYSLLRSKTFWALVISFLVGGVNAITNTLPPDVVTILMLVLNGSAAYFHLQTAQTAGATN